MLGASGITASAAWEPVRPVEFIVPAGTGGGADQMARTIQGIVTKHNLMKQPLVVINKSGGAGGEGFLDVKAAQNNPHKIIITLSNLFTTPLATGIPFNWKDLTPVAMLALDEFVLWVNAEKPYANVKDYVNALKQSAAGTMKMGGTGSKQEDQIITVALEKASGAKLTYIPYKGGGEVAVGDGEPLQREPAGGERAVLLSTEDLQLLCHRRGELLVDAQAGHREGAAFARVGAIPRVRHKYRSRVRRVAKRRTLDRELASDHRVDLAANRPGQGVRARAEEELSTMRSTSPSREWASACRGFNRIASRNSRSASANRFCCPSAFPSP